MSRKPPLGLKDLRTYLRPLGIAVIYGHGYQKREMDADTLLHSWGYDGPITTVAYSSDHTPSGASIADTLKDARGAHDVALISTGPQELVQVLQGCINAGIKHVVCIPGGFEGWQGLPLRNQVRAFLDGHRDFHMIGPNCPGILSVPNRTILTTSSMIIRDQPISSGASLVMQSGGIAAEVFRALQNRGVGIDHWITTGDELDIGAIEVTIALLQESSCKVVGLFLEGVTDAHNLRALQATIRRFEKPVIALRCGSADEGRRAAFGHTGRIVGRSDIAMAALSQAGVSFVHSIEEFCDVMGVLSVLPAFGHRREAKVGVITGAGGAGVLAADEIAKESALTLNQFSVDDVAALRSAIGPKATIANPLDLPSLDDPAVYERAVQALASSADLDAIMVLVTSLAHDFDKLSAWKLSRNHTAMVMVHWSPDESFSHQTYERLHTQGVASGGSISSVVKALGLWALRGDEPVQPSTSTSHDTAIHTGLIGSQRRLGGHVVRWLAEMEVVSSVDEAIEVAAKFGGHVALKSGGDSIRHRWEVGAIALDLTPITVGDAFSVLASICRYHGDEIVVQSMADAGLEVHISVVRDPEMGPAAICRLGGTLVELSDEKIVLFPDLSSWRVQLEGTALGSLLVGYRGQQPYDVPALFELVTDLLACLEADSSILLIECNPVVVYPAGKVSELGACIVDISVYSDTR